MGVSPAWIEVDASHLCNPPILGMWNGREDGRKRVPQEKRRGVRGKFGASGLKNPHPAKRLLFPTSQMPKDTR